MIIFSRKTPMVVGYQHFRKPPNHLYMFLYFMPFHSLEKSTIPKQFAAAALQLPPLESPPPHEGSNLGVFNGFAVDGS